MALEAAPKALVYAAVIVSVGVAAARMLFLARVSAAVDSDAHVQMASACARVAWVAAAALIIGLLLRAWTHTAVSFGVAESFTWENLRTVAWESQWAEAWTLQLAAAVTLVVFGWGLRPLPQVAWTLYGLTAVAMCYALPQVGHAAGEPSRVLLHGSHVLGAGVWIGTLAVMALAAPRDARGAMLHAFAPIAFVGSAVIGISGLIAAWLYLQSPANLVMTTYGWVLALKLLFVADVATFGFINWRRRHGPGRAGESASGRDAARQDVFVYLEVAAAVAVVLITALLTEVEHP